MAWIESHQALATHRKVYRLAQELHISRAEAIGHLHLLWWWALDNAPDGDLSQVSDGVLATVSGFFDTVSHRFGKRFDTVSSRITYSFQISGWIDSLPNGGRKLHDWEDYAGKLVQAREADRQRHRKSAEAPGKFQGKSAEAPGKFLATVPNRTQPNSTEHESPTPLTPPDQNIITARKLWEENMGVLTPILVQNVDQAVLEFGLLEFQSAIERVVKSKGKGMGWTYFEKVLRNKPTMQWRRASAGPGPEDGAEYLRQQEEKLNKEREAANHA